MSLANLAQDLDLLLNQVFNNGVDRWLWGLFANDLPIGCNAAQSAGIAPIWNVISYIANQVRVAGCEAKRVFRQPAPACGIVVTRSMVLEAAFLVALPTCKRKEMIDRRV